MPLNTLKAAIVFAAFALLTLVGCAKKPAPADGAAVPQGKPDVDPAAPPSLPKFSPYSRLVAVCIGIDKYKSSDFRETSGAENDADAVAKVLRTRYGFETVVLKGKAATREAILAAIQKYVRELDDESALIVSFAGHGYVLDLPSFGRAGFLIPFDADLDPNDMSRPEEWAAKALDMRGLVKSVEDAPAKHVLFAIDACYSGFMTRRGDLAARHDLQELLAARSRTVIAATTDRASAIASEKDNRGKFSLALTQFLETCKGAQSVTDVFINVRQRVVKDSARIMRPMRGDFGDANGEFVFLPSDIPEGEVKVAIEAVRDRARKRTARRTTDADFAAVFDAANFRFGPNPPYYEKLWQQKLERFRENAAQGEHLALAAEALCEAKRLGSDTDPARAYQRALLAHETGRPEGTYALGYCLTHGIGVQKNPVAGYELIRKAVRDRVGVIRLVASDRLLDIFNEKSYAVIRSDSEEIAKTGILTANTRAVRAWVQSGAIPDKDRASLTPILTELADAGNPIAQYYLYRLAVLGRSDLSDDTKKEALRRLTQSADQGYVPAQIDLSAEYFQRKFFEGRLGLKRDTFEAGKWADYASDQLSPKGCQILAMMFFTGDGPKKDVGKADRLAVRAYELDEKADLTWYRWFSAELEKETGKK